MFELVSRDDTVELPPSLMTADDDPAQLGSSTEHYVSVLKLCLCNKYSGKIIPNVGMCVTIADIIEWGGAHIIPAVEGSAWVTVKFTAVVFRPFVGEKISARIQRLKQTAQGIWVTLGFFDQIFVPSSELPPPSYFDEGRQEWFFHTAVGEGKPPVALAALVPEGDRCYYERKDLKDKDGVRREREESEVTLNVKYVTIREEKDFHSGSGEPLGRAVDQQPAASDYCFPSASLQPMEVVGSFNGTGLGPRHWY